MIEILDGKGEALDLPDGFTVDMELTSPVFNDRGSMSLPATVPPTARNLRMLGHPQRLDNAADPRRGVAAWVRDGVTLICGTLNVDTASASEGVSFNIGVDNSVAYEKWAARILPDLSGLPTLEPDFDDHREYSILPSIERLRDADPQVEPLAVFPFELSDGLVINGSYRVGMTDGFTMEPPTKRYTEIDGERTEVSLPAMYAVSPLLRVWAVIDYVFADLGMTVEENIFRTDPELCRLVVLNNTADACVRGRVEFADLMPDVSVETFMHSLWVRFGLVYAIDSSRSTVRLRFVRDIVKALNEGEDLAPFLSCRPLVTFTVPQYVRLSASTSIEGAAPPMERWEDFVRAHRDSDFLYGMDVGAWSKAPDPETGFTQDPPDYAEDDPSYSDPDFWPDPDEGRDPDYDDYYDQEPDDDRDDGRDEGRDDDRDDEMAMDSRAATSPGISLEAGQATADAVSKKPIASYECFTGQWYKLDRYNGKTERMGSSYFNYDPQPEGLEAFDLASDDVWLPVGVLSAGDHIVEAMASAYGPRFHVGPRHLHTFIAGVDEEEGECPLAFAWAFPGLGCVIPEDPATGKPIEVDGRKHTTSLLFQFQGGLFQKFWSGFDEFLRHANNTVEVSATLPLPTLLSMDLLAPVNIGGVPLLPDMVAYSIPTGHRVPVDLTLRSRLLRGTYDIEAEQGVAQFGPLARELAWYLYREDIAESVRGRAAMAKALEAWRRDNGEAQWVDGLAPTLRVEPATYTTARQVTWRNDPRLTAPVSLRQRLHRNYYVRATYRVIADYYEQDAPETGAGPVGSTLLGTVDVSVVYTVELRVRVVTPAP